MLERDAGAARRSLDPSDAATKKERVPQRGGGEGERDGVTLRERLVDDDARAAESDVLDLRLPLPARAHMGDDCMHADRVAGVGAKGAAHERAACRGVKAARSTSHGVAMRQLKNVNQLFWSRD